MAGERGTVRGGPPGATPVPAYLLGFVLIGIALTMSGPALSHLRDRMDTNDGGIALVFVAQSVGYILGTALAGRGLDRGRGHIWWSSSMGILVGSVFLIAVAPNLVLLAFAFSLLGATCGLGDVSGNTLVMWSRPEGSGALLNALHLCFALGAVTAPLLVNRSLHWFDSMWAMTVPVGLLAVIFAAVLVRHPSPVHSRTVTRDRSAAGGARALHVGLVALFFFSYVALEGGFAGWIHTYVEQIHYGNAATATGVVTTFWAGFTLGRVAAIALARRVPAGWLVASSMAVTVLASVLFAAFRSGGPMLWVVTFLFAVSIAPQYASMMAFAESHLALNGRNTAVLVGASGVGGLFLPWLLGQLFDSVGPQALPPVMIIASIFAAVVAWIAGRALLSGHRPPATSMNVPVT